MPIFVSEAASRGGTHGAWQAVRPVAGRRHAFRAVVARHRSRHGGFTLIELLVVLGIAGLLLLVVPPAIDKARDLARFRSAVQTMALDLAEARRLAARRGIPVAFEIDVPAGRFGLAGQAQRELPPAVTVRIAAAAAFSDPGRGRYRFIFYPDGGSTGGSIDLMQGADRGTRLELDWLDSRTRTVALTASASRP